ncbi:MAG: S8 family serine peptidase [Acidobacteriota bacterium]|nr:S8 family serine peptidase [Acidobacteriota bacterium]
MPIDHQLLQRFEDAMLDSGWGRRLTQDSPILPDVWVAYAKNPLARLDLLLTPHWGTSAGQLAKKLSDRLAQERDTEVWESGWASGNRNSPRIAYTNTTVAVRLRFDELIRVVLPMTQWWEKYLWEDSGDSGSASDRPEGGVAELLESDEVIRLVAELLVDSQLLRSALGQDFEGFPTVTSDLLWMTRLVGLVAVRGRHLQQDPQSEASDFENFLGRPQGTSPTTAEERAELRQQRLEAARRMIEATRELVVGMDEARDDAPAVWMVNRNRPAEACIFDSALAVKADAARRLFDIDCSGLTWAVIDSGIDATHPAFAERDPRKEHRPPTPRRRAKKRARRAEQDADSSASEASTAKASPGAPPDHHPFRYKSRVQATYDFSLVRYLLSPNTEALEEDIEQLRKELRSDPRSPRSRARFSRLFSLEGLLGLLATWSGSRLEQRKTFLQDELSAFQALSEDGPALPEGLQLLLEELQERDRRELEALAEAQAAGAPQGRTLEDKTQKLRENLQLGRAVNWSELEDYLNIPHDEGYRVPEHNHGTHVAGILGGEWLTTDAVHGNGAYLDENDLVGVAPDIRIYDLRVLGDDGTGDEFSVIAALQFVRYLNENSEVMKIQGANLSLSIHHAVSNYACGRTPVCEESERLVSNGVVVVAAGGNGGYLKLRTSDGRISEGYATVSITDPGNAEEVLTVGATHRAFPHAYGVSYFSSRGPTGDGRLKPDLVAPGEKITAPVPGAQMARLDGTSMAAPHASGVAALLMARHAELMGQPRRIKEILCATATDLGRERYFQGAGMIDALRALQSV